VCGIEHECGPAGITGQTEQLGQCLATSERAPAGFDGEAVATPPRCGANIGKVRVDGIDHGLRPHG
jgi:hypothetical protein